MKAMNRIYNLHSDVTKFRYEHELSDTNPLDIEEVAEAVNGLFTELVADVPDDRRADLARLGQHLFFQIGRPGGDKAIAEWITTVEEAAKREQQRLLGEMVRPAEIGRAQQKRARTLRPTLPTERYEEIVQELHEKDPEASWNAIQLRAALRLGVSPRTVRRRIGKKPW